MKPYRPQFKRRGPGDVMQTIGNPPMVWPQDLMMSRNRAVASVLREAADALERGAAEVRSCEIEMHAREAFSWCGWAGRVHLGKTISATVVIGRDR